MPTVDIDPDELRELTGHADKDDEQLEADLFNLGLEHEGESADGGFELEFAPDRLDRLSVEGIARSLRYQYGDDRGVYVPETNDAEWTIEVDGTPEERPYVTGAVVRGLADPAPRETARDDGSQAREGRDRRPRSDDVEGRFGV